MSDKFTFNGPTQFTNKPKGSVTNTQNINYNSTELNRKIDEMFAEINENQSAEINTLIDALFQKIDESRLKANDFSDEQIEDFNKSKYSNDTKAKIKWTYPLSGIIKELTGFSFELEKEWKRSKEIKPDWVINGLRKIIPAHELQQTNFNKIETTGNNPKALNE